MRTPLPQDLPEEGERPQHDLDGVMLGNYQVIRRIARGGMGDIYLAMHSRLGGQVAIKVLRPDLANRPDVVELFFNEASAVNQIGHPNIVSIIDFVELYDQSPPLVYLVMEFLQGQDLGTYLRVNGQLSAADAVDISLQVARALAAAHAVQIIHRDLKPENIYLLDTDEDGHRVKLLDFGVARAFGEQHLHTVPDPNTTVGTAEYMAPEQATASPQDARTDIYALGVVIYEMLSGDVPFTAPTIRDLFIKVLRDRPAPLSKKGGGHANVDLRLEAIVLRCLLKEPAKRFQSAKDLISALDGYRQTKRSQGDFSTEDDRPFRPREDFVVLEDEPESALKWKLLIVIGLLVFGVVIGLIIRIATIDPPPEPEKIRPVKR